MNPCPPLQVPVAITAWRELLSGRFRLLDRWCAYMTDLYKALVVTEDTWVQVGCSSSNSSATTGSTSSDVQQRRHAGAGNTLSPPFDQNI